MTARAAMEPLSESSLAALAFVQAVSCGNRVNWSNLLDTTSREDMLIGLASVAAKFAQALAVASNCTVEDVFEVHRSLFLLMGGE